MDNELERIKQRRLEEMKRQMLLNQIKDNQEPEPEPETPRVATNQEILDAMFGARAWEVFNAAAYQYPQVIGQVEKILVNGIKEGKITDTIDGAILMGFFRQVGLPVRLNTKIRISDKGELKTLEQKMKEEED
jgi:DNA-binding TFAR19-related protein (PDSD5 family)